MKVTIIRTLKIIAVLLPVLALVILDPGSTSGERNYLRDYYREEENTLDVVLLGASEVFTGFCAPKAYEDWGFTSYPYAISRNPVEFYRSQLEEIYRHQSPQLVVIEVTGLGRADQRANTDAVLRDYLGRIPMSMNRLRTAWTYGDREHLLSYFVPFMMYHNTVGLEEARKTISEELFFYKQGYSLLKCNTSSTAQEPFGTVLGMEAGSQLPLSEYSEETIRSLLEYCKERQFGNLLFVVFPHRNTSESVIDRGLRLRSAGELIKSYGYDFINFDELHDELGLDYAADFYNDDHLNLYGKEKLTAYLSRMMVEEYGVKPTPLNGRTLNRWNYSQEYTRRYYAYFDKLYHEHPEHNYWFTEDEPLIRELRLWG